MNEDERIGQLLVREGVISHEDLDRALEAQKASYGKPLGEIMIGMDIIEEVDFLRVLAKKFRTQYLTTKKLSGINISDAMLALVPVATAEKYNLFPVQFKRGDKDKTLTVVMSDPHDVAAIDEVKFVSGIANIKTLVGLRDAITAAINKWYKGDKNAFSMLEGLDDEETDYGYGDSPPASNLESPEGDLDLERIVVSSDGADDVSLEGADGVRGHILGAEKDSVFLGDDVGDQANMDDGGSIVIESLSGEEPIEEIIVSPFQGREGDGEDSEPVEEVEVKPVSRRPDVKKFRLRMLVVESHDDIRRWMLKLFRFEKFQAMGVKTREEAIEELDRGEYDSLVIKDRDIGEGEEFAALMAERFPGVELCSIKDYGSALIGETRAHKRLMASFLETLDIVMGLLEMESGGLQGHSHNSAKYARLIASKLDLPQKDVDTIALAAYVHDLGKKGMSHRTVLELDKDTDAEELMEQTEIPLKLLSAAKYPLDIVTIIRHQYERWDGEGLPDGMAGEDIPIGSRVLALVQTFEHLTNRYSGKEAKEPTAALELLRKHEGTLFDPKLLDLLLGVVRDDIYLQQMAGAQDRILLVDTEVDFTTLLELRLINAGIATSVARSGAEALEKISADQHTLIITEVELPDMTGLDMIEKVKAGADTKDMPFIFLSKKDDSSSVTRGLRLGAEDYITKPIKVDVLAAKIEIMMSKLRAEKKAAPAASGVSGQLSEMGIPDIVQILGAGRKTGCITLENQGNTARIFMEEGQVVNALIDDLKGEEAFYKILYWTQGVFSIDPTAQVTERLINVSIDSLMLEGFRRMDEDADKDGKQEDDIALDETGDFI